MAVKTSILCVTAICETHELYVGRNQHGAFKMLLESLFYLLGLGLLVGIDAPLRYVEWLLSPTSHCHKIHFRVMAAKEEEETYCIKAKWSLWGGGYLPPPCLQAFEKGYLHDLLMVANLDGFKIALDIGGWGYQLLLANIIPPSLSEVQLLNINCWELKVFCSLPSSASRLPMSTWSVTVRTVLDKWAFGLMPQALIWKYFYQHPYLNAYDIPILKNIGWGIWPPPRLLWNDVLGFL